MKFATALAIVAAWAFMTWVWGKIRDPLIIAFEGATPCQFIIWVWEIISREPLITAVRGTWPFIIWVWGNIREPLIFVLVWEPLINVVKQFMIWVWGKIRDPLFNAVKGVWGKTGEPFVNAVKGVWRITGAPLVNILFRPAPPPQKTRESVKDQIMDALKDDNTHFIGICGMGCVGKTTLVREIGRRVKQTGLFSKVVMAVVSKPPSVAEIQKEIARLIRSESHRESIWEKIKAMKKPTLVILDDVWDELDLKAVGIPFGNDHRGCKVVITTRSRGVCNRMGVQKIVRVDVLNKKEAWVLFREMAGGEALDSSDLNHIAREVADECGGVPRVIVTIATALKNKNECFWAVVAEELKNSNPTHIPALEKHVYPKLELSFNYLEREEAKLLFLLCSLFPEDHDISVEDLMRYAVGLKVFGDVNTIEEARTRTYDEVRSLIDSFMLLDGSEEGFVKMHDVLRDVAIYISSKHDKYRFKVMAGLKNWPDTQTFENYSAISLISDDIIELPRELSAPKLQTLRIQCNSHLQIPDDFFEGSNDQLIFLEMSGIHFLPILPPSIQPLSNSLRALYLTSCKLEDISMIATLKNLEILSFSGSEIVEIPSNIADLTRLKLLDLTDCKKLKNIAADISKLPDLEELYLPQYFEFANLVGLNSSSRLTRLQIFIPIHHLIPIDQDLLPIDLIQLAQKLTGFNITISSTKKTECIPNRPPYREYKPNPYECKGSLRIKHEGPIQPLLSDWVKLLLEKSQDLVLEDLKNSNRIFSELSEEGFNEIKSLELIFLEGTEYLVNTKESTPRMAFSSLEVLCLSNMCSFIDICPGQLPDNSFRNVRELRVRGCNNILKLVSSSLQGRLKFFEKVRVYDCHNLVHVFEEHVVEEVSLSKLKEIELDSLNNMTHIWKDGPHQFISLCNLEKLHVESCPKLTKLFSPKLLQGLVRLKYLDVIRCNSLAVLFEHDTEIEVPFLRSLNRVSVRGCKNLRCLFSTSIVKGDLEKLKHLTVSHCNKLQNIIEEKKGKQEAASVVFPCLSSISLLRLDKLKSICTGRYTIKWPSLERLEIQYCFEMETFGYGDQVTPQLKKILVKHDFEEQEIVITINGGDLNHVVQNHFAPRRQQLLRQFPSVFLVKA